MSEVVVGEWIETEEREFTRCPSYYAADTETLRVKPGRYPARVKFEGGYTIPMPYWLFVTIPCVRVEGRLYNGFGGTNFSHEELKAGEEVPYHSQDYAYSIAHHVRAGRLVLKPAFEWLNVGTESRSCWQHPAAPKTWAQVAELRAAE